MEVCNLIVNTAELAQFAKGCGISDYTISRAAMDNMGNDGECIEQALCRWWMSSNTHPQHKAHKVKLGFDQLDCPECFHEAEEKLDRGITTLLMNLATLVSNMDDLGDLAESMRIPR